MKPSARMLSNAAISRSLAARSMVLLKNTGGTLPLTGTPEAPEKVALFGVGQIYTVKGGTGSGNVNNLKTISLLEGMTGTPEIQVDPDLARKYRGWGLSHENLCPTILEALGLDHTAVGRSVDDIGENEEVVRYFYMNGAKANRTTASRDWNLITYKITGDANDFSNWEKIKTERIKYPYYDSSR